LDSLEKFKAGSVDFLIATDLAGRGLDITGIDVVINFEVPRLASLLSTACIRMRACDATCKLPGT
jgi:superfamily II DNA/RNA helicase